MLGPDIIARTLSEVREFPKGRFQYHPRSDHHSRLACWCIAVDLMLLSKVLRSHVAEGKVTVGVNHQMLDFKLSRKKNLDLVIARPSTTATTKSQTLSGLAKEIEVRLSPSEQQAFDELPPVFKQPVGPVLVALEAKACMTEHGKAKPRLYDELNSSQQTVHGAADEAIACGLAMVNIADTFISPTRIGGDNQVAVTSHPQPSAALGVIEKVRQLPRRTRVGDDGFDALGIMILSLSNDGSPALVVTKPPAPQLGDGDTYDEMILRAASQYDSRFAGI